MPPSSPRGPHQSLRLQGLSRGSLRQGSRCKERDQANDKAIDEGVDKGVDEGPQQPGRATWASSWSVEALTDRSVGSHRGFHYSESDKEQALHDSAGLTGRPTGAGETLCRFERRRWADARASSPRGLAGGRRAEWLRSPASARRNQTVGTTLHHESHALESLTVTACFAGARACVTRCTWPEVIAVGLRHCVLAWPIGLMRQRLSRFGASWFSAPRPLRDARDGHQERPKIAGMERRRPGSDADPNQEQAPASGARLLHVRATRRRPGTSSASPSSLPHLAVRAAPPRQSARCEPAGSPQTSRG